MSVARMGDICQGYCSICECGMIGTIKTGSSNVLANNKPIAQMNGIVQGNCGHIGILIGTTKNLANGLTIVRLGGVFQGVFTGSVVTGSSDVISS